MRAVELSAEWETGTDETFFHRSVWPAFVASSAVVSTRVRASALRYLTNLFPGVLFRVNNGAANLGPLGEMEPDLVRLIQDLCRFNLDVFFEIAAKEGPGLSLMWHDAGKEVELEKLALRPADLAEVQQVVTTIPSDGLFVSFSAEGLSSFWFGQEEVLATFLRVRRAISG